MSEYKCLIDTNVVVGLEDNKPTERHFADLARLSSEQGVRLFVHPSNLDDIARDNDLDRRAITLGKIAKFARLAPIPARFESELLARTIEPRKPNDVVDIKLLAALHAGAVDFLVTEDLDLHKRAIGLGLGNKVLTVREAVEWLRQTYEPKEINLPFVYSKKVYQLDTSDPIFDSLRQTYEGFDDWFAKCVREHRDCWTVEVRSSLAGFIIRKNETRAEAMPTKAGEKILKICTFKLSEDFRGQKFGEHLLKQVLWYAQKNGFDLTYLTAYPDQRNLIELLTHFGFERTRTNSSGELYLERAMFHGDTDSLVSVAPLEMHRRIYPRFLDSPNVKKFYIPILPEYHARLFPEISFATELPLFPREKFGDVIAYGPTENRIPGNTIRKVYLCRAQTKSLRPGDLLLFYKSKDPKLIQSQCLTTIGIVERVTTTDSLQALVSLTAKRSVFSERELSELLLAGRRSLLVIDFFLAGHIDPPVQLHQLQADGLFRHPPQSIAEIPHIVYERLKSRLNLGYGT